MECTCGRVKIDNEVVGRNWLPECPLHGVDSDWYKRCGKDYFDAYRAYSVELQALAREARNTGQSLSHRIPPPPKFEDFCID